MRHDRLMIIKHFLRIAVHPEMKPTGAILFCFNQIPNKTIAMSRLITQSWFDNVKWRGHGKMTEIRFSNLANQNDRHDPTQERNTKLARR